MKYSVLMFSLFLALDSVSCNEGETVNPSQYNYDFQQGTEGWIGGFADYPVGEETFYELSVEPDFLPSPLDQTQGAIKQAGSNRSDDLFMFIKRKIDGLEPNQFYELQFSIEFATDAAANSVGIGGSPAESVYLKIGAHATDPTPIIDSDNFYRMNIDKGNQSQGGTDMIVIGDFSNGTDEFIYTLKTLENDQTFTAQTNGNGELWLIVGTDSGFEGKTTIYYNKISVELQ